MPDAIIVVNSGSTSLKFGAYAEDACGSLSLLCRGQIDAMQDDPHFVAKNSAGKPIDAHEWGEGHAIDHKTASALCGHLAGSQHRRLEGGGGRPPCRARRHALRSAGANR